MGFAQGAALADNRALPTALLRAGGRSGVVSTRTMHRCGAVLIACPSERLWRRDLRFAEMVPVCMWPWFGVPDHQMLLE
jgi:hypothetical protein